MDSLRAEAVDLEGSRSMNLMRGPVMKRTERLHGLHGLLSYPCSVGTGVVWFSWHRCCGCHASLQEEQKVRWQAGHSTGTSAPDSLGAMWHTVWQSAVGHHVLWGSKWTSETQQREK